LEIQKAEFNINKFYMKNNSNFAGNGKMNNIIQLFRLLLRFSFVQAEHFLEYDNKGLISNFFSTISAYDISKIGY